MHTALSGDGTHRVNRNFAVVVMNVLWCGYGCTCAAPQCVGKKGSVGGGNATCIDLQDKSFDTYAHEPFVCKDLYLCLKGG